MSQLNLVLAVLGGLTLVLSLSVDYVRGRLWPLSEPLLATLTGIAVGPAGLGWLGIAGWGDSHVILEEVARVIVALAVLGAALRLPAHYFARQWRAMAVALGPVMAGAAIISGLCAWGILGLPFWEGALIGAILSPTDPVTAGAIVAGPLAAETLPARLRRLLSAEFGRQRRHRLSDRVPADPDADPSP